MQECAAGIESYEYWVILLSTSLTEVRYHRWQDAAPFTQENVYVFPTPSTAVQVVGHDEGTAVQDVGGVGTTFGVTRK
jgi:hypothetical protein